MTPTQADSILTRFRSTSRTGLEVTGGGTSQVCVYNAQINYLAHILCFWESQNVMQGAHNFTIRDTTLYVAQNVCTVTTALMV
jgi:hypothetical protein